MSDAVTLRVRLTPRGGSDRIEGWIDDPERPGARLLKVRTAAPPVDGNANKALIGLLAKAAGVGKSSIQITSGKTARTKSVRIIGITQDQLNGL